MLGCIISTHSSLLFYVSSGCLLKNLNCSLSWNYLNLGGGKFLICFHPGLSSHHGIRQVGLVGTGYWRLGWDEKKRHLPIIPVIVWVDHPWWVTTAWRHSSGHRSSPSWVASWSSISHLDSPTSADTKQIYSLRNKLVLLSPVTKSEIPGWNHAE